jgi:putative membrane protein
MMGMGVGLAWILVCGGLLLLVIVVAVGWLAQRLSREQATLPSTAPSPPEVLRHRYAAGEIDEDEYFRRLSGLSA